MNENISNIIKASIDVKKQILENTELLATIEKVVEVIMNAFNNGNRVYFCGNGGSAADAERMNRSRWSAARPRLCRAWARIAWCMVGTAENHVA